jgi:hypothetical protein
MQRLYPFAPSMFQLRCPMFDLQPSHVQRSNRLRLRIIRCSLIRGNPVNAVDDPDPFVYNDASHRLMARSNQSFTPETRKEPGNA